MKLKTIIASSMAILSMGAVGSAFAGSVTNYYPPERIHCSVQGAQLVCEGFNHRYLTEDMTTADFNGKDLVFAFTSGAAYYTLDKSQATIFFTYKNSSKKAVRLRTSTTDIRPDFNNGKWEKIQDDLYVCKAGYMQCPITSLPSRA